MSTNRNYYCTRQFSELTLNLEIKNIGACCAAESQRIDFEDLQKNQLFNTARIKNDREQMLSNQRITSCETSCWSIEDYNLPSIRLLNNTSSKIYQTSHIEHLPTINLILGSRCTLTCVYCSKIYSRAWADDIKKNGPYDLADTNHAYEITKKDKIIKILDQKTLYSGDKFNQLLNHLRKNKDNISIWYISGGEPFLYENQLSMLLDIIPQNATLIILSGLGLPKNKFTTVLEQLKHRPNFKLGISAENTGPSYEFARYGNSYNHFLELLNCVRESKVKYQFYSTLSNVTAFGYVDFVNFIDPGIQIEESLCSSPSFLKPQTMDRDSKNIILENIDKQNNPQFEALEKLLSTDYEVPTNDKQNLSNFLQEFSTRRNLKLDIFPKTFLKWLDINVV